MLLFPFLRQRATSPNLGKLSSDGSLEPPPYDDVAEDFTAPAPHDEPLPPPPPPIYQQETPRERMKAARHAAGSTHTCLHVS